MASSTKKSGANMQVPPAIIGGEIGTRAKGAAISDQQWRSHVEVAAYYIAEQRGFPGGSELQDWAEAELQIDRLLKENRLAL